MCVLKATKTLLWMQVINDREVESLNVLIALLTFISKLQPVGGQEIMLQTAYRQGSLLKTLWWCIQNRNEGYDAFFFISLWKWNFLGSRYFPVFKSHYSGNDFFGHVLWMGATGFKLILFCNYFTAHTLWKKMRNWMDL